MSFMTESLFYNLLYGWMALALLVFVLLLKITAPYGRHTSDRWGPTIQNKWGWFWMEFPALLLFSYFFFSGEAPKSLASYLIYGTFSLHYFNRVFVFPFRMKENGKRMPLVIVLMGIFFNVVNAFFNGYWLGTLAGDYYTGSWLTSPLFIAGIVLFITGMGINLHADNKLLGLRKGGKKGYYIPQGGLFNYVSSPNLLGEMIEWSGWAVMAWSLPAFSFALWTFANLIPRALDHHRWYRQKFADYPENRKAVFPKLL